MSAEWRMCAACADVDPEVFFPVGASGPVLERQVAAAKAVCAGCPVRAECLAWALATLPHGVAGGLSSEERRGFGTRDSRPVGPPSPGATRAERAEAGRAALAAGQPTAVVAREFGVSERTALRWAGQVRTAEAGAA